VLFLRIIRVTVISSCHSINELEPHTKPLPYFIESTHVRQAAVSKLGQTRSSTLERNPPPVLSLAKLPRCLSQQPIFCTHSHDQPVPIVYQIRPREPASQQARAGSQPCARSSEDTRHQTRSMRSSHENEAVPAGIPKPWREYYLPWASSIHPLPDQDRDWRPATSSAQDDQIYQQGET